LNSIELIKKTKKDKCCRCRILSIISKNKRGYFICASFGKSHCLCWRGVRSQWL